MGPEYLMKKTLPSLYLSLLGCLFASVCLNAESELLTQDQIDGGAPYHYAGKIFTTNSSSSGGAFGSGMAIGPGVILTAAHVPFDDAKLGNSAEPWLDVQEWYPNASSENSLHVADAVALVSLSQYDAMITEYDDDPYDNITTYEVFNRDSLLIVYASDSGTPEGFIDYHPFASESNFFGKSNLYKIIGYPSAKYTSGDERSWRLHTSPELDAFTGMAVPPNAYASDYNFDNHLYSMGEAIDSYAGNSGGPLVARVNDSQEWVQVGVYIGSGGLVRGIDEELSDMITSQNQNQYSRTVPAPLDNLNRIRLVSSSYTVAEGDPAIDITVERLNPVSLAASVDISIINLSAAADGLNPDVTLSGALSWASGESGEKSISLTVLDDDIREGEEHLLLQLGSPSTGKRDSPRTALVSIQDNDLDGILDSWTEVDVIGVKDYSEIIYFNGRFYSCGGTNIVSWDPDFSNVLSPDFPSINRLFQIIEGGGLIMASGLGPELLISNNGTEWETITVDTSANLYSVSYGNGRYVAVGGIDSNAESDDTTNDVGEIWISHDGISWFQTVSDLGGEYEDVEFGNGMFLTRKGMTFYSSPDGKIWTALQSTGFGGEPNDFQSGGGAFISAGYEGAIYRSTDGVDWTQVMSPDGTAWFGVGYRNGYYVATGQNGKLATSVDGGVTWQTRFSGTDNHLWHGVAGAGKMMVIGDAGQLLMASLPNFFDFIEEPQDQVLTVGGSLSLSASFIESTGDMPSLTWLKDGVVIPGETTELLTINNVVLSDRGLYEFSVGIGGETYTSRAAEVSVKLALVAPEITSVDTTTSRGVTIEWDDLSSEETGYRIERRLVGDSEWVLRDEISANSNKYIDRQPDVGPLPNSIYEYRITVIGSAYEESVVSSPVTTAVNTKMINISTRGLVGSGNDLMIGGFVIPSGQPPMRVFIRGLGESLRNKGISNPLENPHLRLVKIGGGGDPIDVSNSSWGDDAQVVDYVEEYSEYFSYASPNEAGLLVTLSAGAYTALLRNEGSDVIGVGSVEIYDASDCEECRFINISTRGLVADGNDAMIGGFVVRGAAKKRLLIRVAGPTLNSANFIGLPDPVVRVVPHNQPPYILDDWPQNENWEEIGEIALDGVNTFRDNIEENYFEVIGIIEVEEGPHTMIVNGIGTAEGNVLMEIYELE